MSVKITDASHFLASPSHKLLLCRVEKVGNTQFSDLMCSLNKHHTPGQRIVHEHRGNGPFIFEPGCDWHTASVNRVGVATAKLQRVLAGAEPGWTRAVFFREPLSRFLSGFISKCTPGHDPAWDHEHICRPIFGSTHPTFAHAADVVGRPGFRMPAGTAGNHWRPQSDFCSGTLHAPHAHYDLVQELERDTSHRTVGAMLRAAGIAPEDEPSYVFHFGGDTGEHMGAHETNSDWKLTQYYTTRETVRKVLGFVAPDYKTFGMRVPHWAVLKAGTDFVDSLGLHYENAPPSPPSPPPAPPVSPSPPPAPPAPPGPPSLPTWIPASGMAVLDGGSTSDGAEATLFCVWPGDDQTPHMVHCHTVHLALGALPSPCTMCGTGLLQLARRSEDRA